MRIIARICFVILFLWTLTCVAAPPWIRAHSGVMIGIERAPLWAPPKGPVIVDGPRLLCHIAIAWLMLGPIALRSWNKGKASPTALE